jgi:carbon starvation protein CstA
MITFIVSVILLIGGYLVYGKFVEKVFGVDSGKVTPAIACQDGVDYVPLPGWKIFLIQFLNIAGLGPIFGAVAGAAWGPVAFLWIVLGCIFAGAVHDYLSGMISLRMNGLSLPEIVGKYLGNNFKQFIRGFTVALLILVGTVFIMGPAGLLAGLTPKTLDLTFWAVVIFIYYILATLLPIDKIIGNIYPVFGLALLIMAVGIMVMMIAGNLPIPELTPATMINMKNNPESFPIFPMLFVTVACGAISGFHSTQSPLMARCMTNEKQGRRIFYGAMIAEGLVALIWAAIAMSFFGGVSELNTTLAANQGNAAPIVNAISRGLMGPVGAVLAILGVVAAPITTGDTAFRSARLIIADFLKLDQKPIRKRILVCLPLFAIGFILTQIEFGIIWRYMAWSNQSLAAVVLWTITVFLVLERKKWLVTLIPALFMTAVCSAYILVAPEGFHIKPFWGQLSGIAVALITLVIFFYWKKKHS